MDDEYLANRSRSSQAMTELALELCWPSVYAAWSYLPCSTHLRPDTPWLLARTKKDEAKGKAQIQGKRQESRRGNDDGKSIEDELVKKMVGRKPAKCRWEEGWRQKRRVERAACSSCRDGEKQANDGSRTGRGNKLFPACYVVVESSNLYQFACKVRRSWTMDGSRGANEKDRKRAAMGQENRANATPRSADGRKKERADAERWRKSEGKNG